MAVTAQAQERKVAPRKSERAARLPGAAWTTQAQIRRSLPIVRLLAEISTIPEVSKIGLLADGSVIIVHVFLSNESRKATSKIFAAERAYLNGTSVHNFDLRITPLGRLSESMTAEILTGLEILLER